MRNSNVNQCCFDNKKGRSTNDKLYNFCPCCGYKYPDSHKYGTQKIISIEPVNFDYKKKATLHGWCEWIGKK